MLDACGLQLNAGVALLPLVVLKEPYNYVFKTRIRCTRASSATAEYNSANDLILIP